MWWHNVTWSYIKLSHIIIMWLSLSYIWFLFIDAMGYNGQVPPSPPAAPQDQRDPDWCRYIYIYIFYCIIDRCNIYIYIHIIRFSPSQKGVGQSWTMRQSRADLWLPEGEQLSMMISHSNQWLYARLGRTYTRMWRNFERFWYHKRVPSRWCILAKGH